VVAVVAGIVLIPLGYTGSVDFGLKVGGVDTHVVTGSLGIAITVIGVVLVAVSDFTFVVKPSGDDESGA
jgi:hypothetical protein